MSATGDAELGHKLRKRRLEGDHGLKQPAHFAGIKPSTLSDYEKGRSTPGVVVLKKLAVLRRPRGLAAQPPLSKGYGRLERSVFTFPP